MKPQTVKIWNKKYPEFYKSEKARFDIGEEINFCLPCTARNCTVLGYNVSPTSKMWQALDWDKEVMIDGGNKVRHIFDAGGEQAEYLHVFAKLEGNEKPDGTYDRARYRVRSRLELGGDVAIQDAGPAVITSIRVAGMWDGRWWWRYTARRK